MGQRKSSTVLLFLNYGDNFRKPKYASGSNLSSNDAKSKLKSVPSDEISLTTESLGVIQGNHPGTQNSLKKSWVYQVGQFSSNLQTKNVFSDDDGTLLLCN